MKHIADQTAFRFGADLYQFPPTSEPYLATLPGTYLELRNATVGGFLQHLHLHITTTGGRSPHRPRSRHAAERTVSARRAAGRRRTRRYPAQRRRPPLRHLDHPDSPWGVVTAE